MPLLTPEQCRAQCRVDGDYADDELAALLASAEAWVAAHLNRSLFVDAAALSAALDALPAAAAAAETAYDDAIAAADAEDDAAKASAMREVAEQRLAAAKQVQARTLAGAVADGGILAAIRLFLGHLWANRETVVVGATVVDMPMGVLALLRPHRRVQMP